MKATCCRSFGFGDDDGSSGREKDVAAIGLVDTRKRLDERRFAGAVFPQQREDFPLTKIDRDVPQRLRAAEALGDRLELQQSLGFHCGSSQSCGCH